MNLLHIRDTENTNALKPITYSEYRVDDAEYLTTMSWHIVGRPG